MNVAACVRASSVPRAQRKRREERERVSTSTQPHPATRLPFRAKKNVFKNGWLPTMTTMMRRFQDSRLLPRRATRRESAPASRTTRSLRRWISFPRDRPRRRRHPRWCCLSRTPYQQSRRRRVKVVFVCQVFLSFSKKEKKKSGFQGLGFVCVLERKIQKKMREKLERKTHFSNIASNSRAHRRRRRRRRRE